ncbi:OmpA family protein [Marinoscillum furvescens]|uniref:Outer membrane protein OmpA-like peptidoglycan-associated protein n=1 Tax=Marinoscillum furvescens DSM 4134 TaxID=1122208 RepID=A0A3D9L4N6_MARFU|nr:OmpA family protein [Marinoscillum furvescens]RED99765.1 outer membrane protein OmpA-like peptidoglycan-associated protein [Marinoscillum furvescens DSM 4134]
MKKTQLFFALAFLWCLSSQASEGKYERLILKADKFYNEFVYPRAIDLYEKALDLKGDFVPYPALQIANSYRLMNKPEQSENWYAKVEENNALTSTEDKINFSQVLLKTGQDKKAKQLISNVEAATQTDLGRLKSLDNIEVFYSDSAAYYLENLPINSDQNDFSPVFYDEGLVFVSNRKTRRLGQSTYYWDETYFLDLFYAPFEGDSLGAARPMSTKLNTQFHEGPAAFLENGEHVIFTRNNFHLGQKGVSEEGVTMLSMYSARKNERGKWDKPAPMPFNSEDYSVGHPAVAPDGKTLYFSSDMAGTHGKADIFKSTYENGVWSAPINMGDIINTAEDELFPYVSEDNVLYFASMGHPGIGGLDVYKVDLNDTEPEVINMGYPINTTKDDFGFILNGNIGYVSSARDGGLGSDDIYRVNVLEMDLTVKLVDAQTGKPVEGNIAVEDQADGSQYESQSGALEGIRLLRGRQLSIAAAAAGYQPASEVFNSATLAKSVESHVIEVALEPRLAKIDVLLVTNPGRANQVIGLGEQLTIYSDYTSLKTEMDKQYADVGELYRLESIFYDFNRSKIRKDAAAQLDGLVALMKKYPAMNVELGAHTDSRGSNTYNNCLAQRRAEKAQEYLIEKGIAAARIAITYFGEDKLVTNCGDGVPCDEVKHQLNRRTEIKVVK